jgi:hypothetical protein
LAGARVLVDALHDDLGIWYRARGDFLESCPSGGVGISENAESKGRLETSVNLETSASSDISGCPEVAESPAVSPRLGELESALPGSAEGPTTFPGKAEPGRPPAASDTDVPTASLSRAGESGHVAADKWSCTCGMHEKQSPERLGQLGDSLWRRTVSQAVRNALAHLSPDVSISQESDNGGKNKQNVNLWPSKTCSDLTREVESGSITLGKIEEASGRSVSNACQSTDTGEDLGARKPAANRAQRQATGCSGAPIVLIVDDSPLLPLLVASHLSELSRQLRNAPDLGTSRLPSSQNSKRVPGTLQNNMDFSMKTGADSRPPDSLATTESSMDVAAQLAVGLSKQPGQYAMPQVCFLDQAGPAGVKGFVERRTAACWFSPAFVPRRIETREGDGGTLNLEGRMVSVHFWD